MVQKLDCECDKRFDTEINSSKYFKQIERFFQDQVDKKIFNDMTDYNNVWYLDGGNETEVYRTTTKYYKCNICGCLWEFNYPEFPAVGSVRKFPDGEYKKQD